MSRFDKLKEMSLDGSSKVTLSTEDGSEIVHYTGEDYEGETIRESGIANSLACLVTSQHLPNNTIINVKAELEITLGELFAADKESPYLFSGWGVAVETPIGVLNVE